MRSPSVRKTQFTRPFSLFKQYRLLSPPIRKSRLPSMPTPDRTGPLVGNFHSNFPVPRSRQYKVLSLFPTRTRSPSITGEAKNGCLAENFHASAGCVEKSSVERVACVGGDGWA